MNDLHSAIQRCLASTHNQLDEVGGNGVSLVLMSADKAIWRGSVTDNPAELLESLLQCAWEALRNANPNISPDGFAQAAYGVATRSAGEAARTAPLQSWPGDSDTDVTSGERPLENPRPR